MELVNIKRLDSNRIMIPHTEELNILFDSFFYYVNADGDNSLLFSVETINNEKMLVIGAGFYDQLIKLLLINGYSANPDDSVKMNNNLIKIIPKWVEILGTDFRVIDNKNQLQYLEQLLKFNRACGQFYTSFGKTELALAVVESYLVANPDKNAVVLIPSDLIKKEFIERSEKWDLSVRPEYHKFKGRFQLINPVGLDKNKKFKDRDPKFIEYFNNVGLLIVDEVHHLTASTYLSLMDNYLTSYEVGYGFSATIDSESGIIPKMKDSPSDLPGRLNKIIKYLGVPRVDVKNPAPLKISYLRIRATKVPEKLVFNYNVSLKIFFNSPTLIDALVAFLQNYPDRRMFIPVFDKAQGKKLVDKLSKRLGADTCIFKYSGGTYPNITEKGYTGIKDYLQNNPRFRVVMGTTAMYEGFDSKLINTVFLAVGKSQRMSLQPTGRGVRSEDIPWVLLPWDTGGHHKIVNKQTRTRYEKLKNEYTNYEFLSLE
ncbi:helicase [Yersinia phage YerA41]|nr:helicase [Yersinia phage YerA41]